MFKWEIVQKEYTFVLDQENKLGGKWVKKNP